MLRICHSKLNLLQWVLVGSVVATGCKKTNTETVAPLESTTAAQSTPPKPNPTPGSVDSETPWSDVNDDTNIRPVAKDAYIEPEKDKTIRIGINTFMAQDGDGDRLTLRPLDQNKKAVSSYRDRFTVISQVAGDPTQLEITSSLIGATSVTIRISDGKGFTDVTLTVSPKNPLSSFRPALALNKVQCLLCHSQIKGNFVSSMGTDEVKTTVGFHNSTSRDTENKGREFDYVLGEYQSYYSRSLFMTSFFQGTIFVPHRMLSSAAQSQAQTLISEGLAPQNLKADTPSIALLDFTSANSDLLNVLKNPQTGGQYLLSMLQFQNQEFISLSRTWAGVTKTIEKKSNIEEVQDLKITAPSEELIAQNIRAGENFSYYPQGSSSANLKNFGLRPVRRGLAGSGKVLWGNDPTQIMDCDGDLFVKGPVFLKDLRLRTKVGCRIHATGVIVISGSLSGNSEGQVKNGYLLVDSTEASNLELVSARAILMGLGYVNETLGGHASIVGPAKRLIHAGFPLPKGTLADVDLFVGASAKDSIVLDAGTDPLNPEKTYGGFMDSRRLVRFDRILVNAPLIHSRYSGDFKGVVIGDFALWSLGQFKYEYDPVFDRVPVLPMIDSANYFKVTPCSDGKKVIRHSALTECKIN